MAPSNDGLLVGKRESGEPRVKIWIYVEFLHRGSPLYHYDPNNRVILKPSASEDEGSPTFTTALTYHRDYNS